MIAVVDTQAERTWTVAGETKPFPATSRVLRPDPQTASAWKHPDAARPGFASVFAAGFGTAETPGSNYLNLVFDGLVSARCDGPGIADGDKGPAQDGPARAALVSQILQAEKFARSLAPARLPEVFRCHSYDLTKDYTFAWSGLILLNGAANGAMPAWKQLSDTELAAVISYTKNSWSNKTGKLVQPAEIVAARK